MISFLRFSGLAFGAAVVGSFAVLGCGGREVGLGGNQVSLRKIAPAELNKAIPSCKATDAHPNVCCPSNPQGGTECFAFIGDPFRPCDGGYRTFPEPDVCCDLNDPGNCAAPPSEPPPPPVGSCPWACAPGEYLSSSGLCCELSAGGKPAVEGGCHPIGGGVVACPEIAVVCPKNQKPADLDGDGCPLECKPVECPAIWPVCPNNADPVDLDNDGCALECPGETPPTPPEPEPVPPPPSPVPTPPTCGITCPPGFEAAINDPSICCRDTPEGNVCFSNYQGPVSSGSTPGSPGLGQSEPEQP